MSVGVPLGRHVRKMGNEPKNVNVGTAVFVRLRNCEIPDMVIEPFPGTSKSAERPVGPSNHCVLNRTLVATPVGPKHHLIAKLRGVVRDGVEHQKPLPARSLKGFNLEAGIPPPDSGRPSRRLDHAPEFGLAGGVYLATEGIEGVLERTNRGCVT